MGDVVLLDGPNPNLAAWLCQLEQKLLSGDPIDCIALVVQYEDRERSGVHLFNCNNKDVAWLTARMGDFASSRRSSFEEV